MKAQRLRMTIFCSALATCMAACTPEPKKQEAAMDGTVDPASVHTSKGTDKELDARTLACECADGTDYVVRMTAKEAWVLRAGLSLQLKRLEGAASDRYVNDTAQLEIEGETCMLTEAGKPPLACRNNRPRAIWEHAKLNGADFRAIGNEPPWVLEIREQVRISLITDYGATRTERTSPQPISDQIKSTTTWDAGDLQIEVTAAECADSMSGEKFSARVVVRWQGKALNGCGRALH